MDLCIREVKSEFATQKFLELTIIFSTGNSKICFLWRQSFFTSHLNMARLENYNSEEETRKTRRGRRRKTLQKEVAEKLKEKEKQGMMTLACDF